MFDHPGDASVAPPLDEAQRGEYEAQLSELGVDGVQLGQGGEWRRMFNNEQQRPYWFNVATGETSWESPPASRPGSAASDGHS